MSPKPKTSPRPEKMSEKSREDRRIEPGAARGAADALWPKRSYSAALLVVGEHGVGLGRFLEALLGGRGRRDCGRGDTSARAFGRRS